MTDAAPAHGAELRIGSGAATVRRGFPALTRFTSDRAAVAGAVVLLALITVAVLAPLVTPFHPNEQSSPPLSGPGWENLLGTDELGRDLFTRLVFGTRSSLLIAFSSALLAAAVGVPIGLIAGYLGRWIDAGAMRVVDLMLAVPGILAALVVVTLLGAGDVNLVIAIGLAQVPAFARLARASTLAVREQEFVLAARGMGAPTADTMTRTVLPNIMSPIIVQIVVSASLAIVIAAGLSFLGLGAPPPAPSWGAMLDDARSYLYQNAWYGVFPGLALALTVAALDLVGRGLQRAFGGGVVRDPHAGGVT